MSRLSWVQKFYWSNFAKPSQDRALFKTLVTSEISSVLEIGVGDGQRIRRVAKLAQVPDDVERLRYVGTDEFEAADDGRPHLTLKHAHQLVGRLSLRATLIPGDFSSAIPRVAHKIGPSDLLIVNGGMDPLNPTLSPICNWLNRLAHASSVMLACQEPGDELAVVDLSPIELPLQRAA
jgi:hypothetical protein